jgi:hypothetical protein
MSQAFESAQPTGHRLKWKLLSPLAGSSSPSYVQLDWRKADPENFHQDEAGDVLFHEFPGDPNARFLPKRLLKTVKLIGMQAAALETLRQGMEEDGRAPQEAVAFSSRHGAFMGVLPEGIEFGTIANRPDERFVAARRGFRALRFVPLVFEPIEGKGYEPAGVQDMGTYLLDDMPARFPDVPVV